jgi:2-hydroxychromene-2-carboxylate isomerase
VPGPIRFHFDLLSPYAYIAWTQLGALAERHGRAVQPVPILLAALLNEYGHKGPAEIQPKRRYVYADCLRTCGVLDLPLAPPPSHPFNPLLALRVASVPMADDVRDALITGLFEAVWAGGGGVETPEAVGAIVAKAGLDPVATLTAAVSPQGKQRVKDQTAQALADGVFGVPTMLVDGALFWGYDSFGHLDRHLAGDGADLSDLDRFEVPASASR